MGKKIIIFFFILNNNLDYLQVDMRGAAYEAVFLYCECAATKQIGLPEG